MPKVTRTYLKATKNQGGWAVLLGWTFATQIAAASIATTQAPNYPELLSGTQHNYPSTLLSAGAYQPEEGYASLDMSMPSYNVEKAEASFNPQKGPDAPGDDKTDQAQELKKAKPAATKKVKRDAGKDAKAQVAAAKQAREDAKARLAEIAAAKEAAK